jgi:AcrR family transcriptional regulator
MREVARRAGVSHQAPNHYFTERGDVLAHIAIDGFDKLSEAMTSALAGPGEPAETCFIAYVNFALTHPAHFRIMFRPELCTVETHAGANAPADRAMGALMMLVHRVGPLSRKIPDARSNEDMVASVARPAAAIRGT